ncbi:MAG: hypothetical protein E6G94_09190 [Alphaproteobacteria bacterium]|nr:MAG: hypothetical protein E6G94_09190 [Alphaproteobacteria bacterium]
MNASSRDNTKTPTRRAQQTGTFVGTRLQPDLLAEIDAWRREQPDLPSRPEALRRLAVKGLRGDRSR